MDNRISSIQNNSKSNEAQEIVNSALTKKIDHLASEIKKTSTTVKINDKPIPYLILNSLDTTISDNFNFTIINCGTSTKVMED